MLLKKLKQGWTGYFAGFTQRPANGFMNKIVSVAQQKFRDVKGVFRFASFNNVSST